MVELGNTTKSRCIGVRAEAQAHGKKIGSIRGRQATIDADWQRTLSDD